jgi:hypothetical protein
VIEFGVFNDEGLLEGQFYSRKAAEEALADLYAEDDEAEVAIVCPDHEEQRREHCEECNAEDDEDADDEDEDE